MPFSGNPQPGIVRYWPVLAAAVGAVWQFALLSQTVNTIAETQRELSVIVAKDHDVLMTIQAGQRHPTGYYDDGAGARQPMGVAK